MNYELAKQLKDAGFPFKLKCGLCKHGIYGAPTLRESCDCDREDTVPIPTLSELIEACEECLSHIKRLPVEGKEYWWAVSHCGHPEHEPGGNNIEEQGSTPEEAVAKLWLELMK